MLYPKTEAERLEQEAASSEAFAERHFMNYECWLGLGNLLRAERCRADALNFMRHAQKCRARIKEVTS